MNIPQPILDHHDEFTGLRRDIHKHPELAYEEVRTADIVAEQLASFNIPVHRGMGKTGVVGTLKCGSSERSIALRADMDALAMEELNQFDHTSINAGKMHGCGHDGHTVMLLAAARYLSDHDVFDGTVHFVFQPAEEGAGGAAAMLKDGLFEQFPAETVWGMHNFPTVPVGQFITRTGPFLASSDEVKVVIQGVGGHGALPHLARSPVNAACTVIQTINDFVAQEINTQLPTTFTVGRISGGNASNVIPDAVEFAGTMRTFSHEVRDQFEEGLHRIVNGVCASRGIEASIDYQRNYPPVVNTPTETQVAKRVAGRVVGDNNINAAAAPIMGSEDFAFMLEKKPGNYIMIGNGEGDLHGCMVHNPHYDFNDDILPIGATYWVELVKELLARP